MKYVTLLLAFLSVGSSAQAFSIGDIMQEDLEFVAQTKIPGADETMMALCHKTRGIFVMGYSFTNDITGYALANDDCEGDERREFTPEQIETARSLGLIPSETPLVARNDLERNIKSYGPISLVVLALLWFLFSRFKKLVTVDPNAPLRTHASGQILLALCHAAKCDGLVSSGEVNLIARTVLRLTKREYPANEIMRLSDHIHLNLSEEDYIDFGKGLRDHEKDAMLRGVLYIAMHRGRLQPNEHKFSTELAHGLGMPPEDFRRVLFLAYEDLDAKPV